MASSWRLRRQFHEKSDVAPSNRQGNLKQRIDGAKTDTAQVADEVFHSRPAGGQCEEDSCLMH